MEVTLVSKRGVPDDAIISIRSGAVRRQGAISADRPFRFPQNVSETDCVVKVDFMQNIGSGYLVMRPNQSEGKQYEVVCGSSDMVCELEVKPTDGERPSAAEAQEDSAAAAKTKQDAKAYLESTGLLAFVQGVLQVVAKQQPADPFAAMAKHFVSASDEAVPPTPGSPKAAPASPKAVAETPAPASPEAEAATKVAVPETEAGTVPPAVEKADSDHVDDNKSDTLEEFTSTVKGATLPAGDDEPASRGVEGEAKEAAEKEAKDGEAKEAAEGEAKAVTEEAANDGSGAAPAASPQEGAEGQGEEAEPKAAETAATGADDQKEETAEVPQEVATGDDDKKEEVAEVPKEAAE